MSPMSRTRKGGQTGGHAFSFAYVYPTADVIWVERAEDVPPWDWTRCGAMEEGPRPPWKSKHGGLLLYAARRAPNPYADAHALPVPAMSYPRIVRRDIGQHFSEVAARVHVEFLKLWKVAEKYGYSPFERHIDAEEIRQHEGEKKFREAVAGVALRAGILSPHGTADSIHDWWKAALEVAVWAHILRAFEDINAEMMLPEWFWPSIEMEWGIEGLHIPEGARQKQVLSLIRSAQGGYSKYAGGDGTIKTREARSIIAQSCLFPQFITPAMMYSTPHAQTGLGLPTVLRAEVGALDWARYELAQLYGAVQTRTCALSSCSAVFVPKNRSGRFCSPTCRGNEKKARQRASAKAVDSVTTASQPQ